MSFFSRLFGPSEDPTKDWPALHGSLAPPSIDFGRQALESFGGKLAFGDSLTAARFLGRPDRCEMKRGFSSVDYDRWGLRLKFESDSLAHVSFAIGRASREGPSRLPAEPRGPDGMALSVRTTKDDLLQRFGPPTRTQELEDETILYYSHPPLGSEFQLDKNGRLTGWDVYVD